MFVKATAPLKIKDKKTLFLSHALAGLLALMALAQLVTFEEFVLAIQSYGVTNQKGAVAIAITLLSLEIFALPFVLRMWLSPVARAFSALFLLLGPLLWLALTTQAVFRSIYVENYGFFGGLIHKQVTELIVFESILILLAASTVFALIRGADACLPLKRPKGKKSSRRRTS